MPRPTLEVADVFRRHGAGWRAANEAHLSLPQRRVMTAIEICRTAALGGHVERCEDCAHTRIAYNSCRNRHCPKCQWMAAQAWLEAREAELLPVPYFHVVFTLPAAIGAIAYQNKAKVYGLLFTAAAETLTTIAADPKHLGADIGLTAVLHTWGQSLDHNPHVHCIVPGGGVSPGATVMRIMEIGIRAVAKSLGIPDPIKPSDRGWHHILKQIKDEIDARYAGKVRTWSHQGDKELFESSYASLDAVTCPVFSDQF
jgi:Transposase zinc-binding domain/Putative transposase